MSSTCWRVRASSSTPSGRIGAIENPQLPAITVVTPWNDDGVSAGVPEDLGVVVGVDVDEAGRHHLARGVELPVAAEPVAALSVRDGRDAAAVDAHVRRPAGRPGAVDHRARP